MKDYVVLDELIPKTQELHRAIFDKGYEQGQTYILDKIRAEIQSLRNCSCSCSDGIIDDVEDIIDKYKTKK